MEKESLILEPPVDYEIDPKKAPTFENYQEHLRREREELKQKLETSQAGIIHIPIPEEKYSIFEKLMGYAIAGTIVCCLCSIIIAIAVKIIFRLF